MAGGESIRARIHLHFKRLSVALAINREPHRIHSGERGGSAASVTESPACAALARRRGTKVPHPAMHSRRRGERSWGRSPDGDDVKRVGIDLWRAVFARITTHGFACRIENLQRDRP